MAAVAAVPADAGALGFHPSNDTRAELVNCSIKQAKPDTFHSGHLAWGLYPNFPPLSDKAIYRQWPGTTQNKGREAGKIEEVTFIAHRSELRAGRSHGYELDRAKPVGEMHTFLRRSRPVDSTEHRKSPRSGFGRATRIRIFLLRPEASSAKTTDSATISIQIFCLTGSVERRGHRGMPGLGC